MALYKQLSTVNTKTATRIFVRLSHTALTVAVIATILVKDTGLHDAVMRVNLAYVFAYFALVLGSLVMYYVACWVDPGYVPLPAKKRWSSISDEEENTTEHSTMLTLTSDEPDHDEVKLHKCGFCGITQPLRARHCEDCGRCVQKYDHHCPWLETCVGERNHKYFLMFVVSETALIIWTACIVWYAFVFHLSWGDWFRENMFFLIDMLILCVGGFVTTCLSVMHTYMMMTNNTTWEMVSRERISYLKTLNEELNPFHEGYCKNAYRFMCQRGLRKWEAVYKRKTASKGLDV